MKKSTKDSREKRDLSKKFENFLQISRMKLSDNHIEAIRKSWSRETCYPEDQDRWSETNPAIGQCAVTALLVQDIL